MKALRKPFIEEWNITSQKLPVQNPIQHIWLKLYIKNSGKLPVTNAKKIKNILDTCGLEDCNPEPKPHVDRKDASEKRRPD